MQVCVDCLFVCLVGFLTSSSTTRLYRGRAPRQSVRQFYVLSHMRQSWETMTSVSAGHIILTPTQPVGSGRLQRPGPLHQESRALPTELPPPPPPPGLFRSNNNCKTLLSLGINFCVPMMPELITHISITNFFLDNVIHKFLLLSFTYKKLNGNNSYLLKL